MSADKLFFVSLILVPLVIYLLEQRKPLGARGLNSFQRFLCARRNHKGHAHPVIESNEGTHKIRCSGCGSVFLEGRKIKVVLTK